MIELFFAVVIVGVVVIDHRLHKLLKVQREIHAALLSANAARSETLKALQWMVDKLAVMKKIFLRLSALTAALLSDVALQPATQRTWRGRCG
jgi:hypothetical protein